VRRNEPAICLRTTDYRETSQVVWFLARQTGLVGLLAKGTKRPKSKSGGAIDITGEGNLVFLPASRGTLGTLLEFTETAVHAGLRQDMARLNPALYMLEVTGASLAEEDPHPEVFDLLHNGLRRLDESDSHPPAVLAYFQWRLLRHMGLGCRLDACVSCGRPVEEWGGRSARDVWFSSTLGGLLCGDCEPAATEKYKLDGPTRAALAALTAAETGARVTLPDNQARGVNRLLAYRLQYQLGKPLRMAPHVTGRRRRE